MGNSRKYPYPTMDGFHILTPPPPPPHAFRNSKTHYPPCHSGIDQLTNINSYQNVKFYVNTKLKHSLILDKYKALLTFNFIPQEFEFNPQIKLLTVQSKTEKWSKEETKTICTYWLSGKDGREIFGLRLWSTDQAQAQSLCHK